MGKNTLKGKVKIFSYFVAFIFMVVVHIAIDKRGVKEELNEEYAKLNGNAISTKDSLCSEEEGTLGFISMMKTKSVQLIQMERHK